MWPQPQPRRSSCLTPDEQAPKRQRRERVICLPSICPTLTLVCKDGKLPVCGEVLRMASPSVLNDMIKTAQETDKDGGKEPELQVEETVEEWIGVLSLLYPEYPRPGYTCELVLQVLPAVHKYDMANLLSSLQQWIREKLSDQLGVQPPSYIVNWLALSEQLQLTEIKDACFKAFTWQGGSFKNVVRQDTKGEFREQLMPLSQGLMYEVFRAILDR